MSSERLFDLSGKVAIVTGASGGLGRHFALALARAGAKVALGARRIDLLADLARQIEGFDGRAIPVQLDVTDAESIRGCVETAETELGPVSILVNNAGIGNADSALDLEQEDWDRVIATNLTGAWLMARETARHMAALGHGGSIVNVASVLGLGAARDGTAYCAAKAGLVNLTRAMAIDLAGKDIRVNALAPGWFETDMTHELLSGPGGEVVRKRIPQRRIGQPQDLEGALVLLASDASRYMTGSVIVVDGGLNARA
jgi:NAD(P)-dependent dehydrogenase (short-subunit alcohol dehydrogenase family)